LALLAFANVMSNKVIPNWLYVPWNVTVALALLWVARHDVTREQMGFTKWKRGAAWGAALFALTAGVLLVGLLLPAFNDMYDDKRVTSSVWAWAYHAFLRIPLGTAFMEETAFRAVLPALFAVRWGVLRGCIAASVLFGFWHVLPSLGLNEVNPTMTELFGDGAAGVAAAVAFAVVGTAIAGLGWCWIRYRSGSILSTIIGHVATNSIAYTIAFWVNR
jgi:membrane protease YdiL (CAAX protease family)